MLEYLIDRGLQDDEIIDEFDRAASRDQNGQELAVLRTGDREYTDWGSLRGRRQILALLASVRGDPSPQGVAPDPAMTAYATEKIAEVPEAVRYVRRSNRRGVSINAVAIRIGVDRGTLTTWIERGWVSLEA